MTPAANNLSHLDYTIAWICALPLELAGAELMLDERHPDLPTSQNDDNTYILGRICPRNVVILCLPSGIYGTTAATALVTQMRSSFGAICFGLMVGIGEGVPCKGFDIRLGDIVVSKPTREFGGVIQYDYGKTIQDGRFERLGLLNKPPPVLLTAVARLQAAHKLKPSQIPTILSEIADSNPFLSHILEHPGENVADLLFESDYEHCEALNTCHDCDSSRLVKRIPRDGQIPVIHYGLIASGNQVMKHGRTRDKLAKRGVLCFEMEAAGLMDKWQEYAAAIAAAYAKELLSVIHAVQVVDEPTVGSSNDIYHYKNKDLRDMKWSQSLPVRQERDQLDDWLFDRHSDYDHNRVHRRLCHKRLLGTIVWFLDHPDFKKWSTGNTVSSLWCSERIGSGKTVIATSVIENMKYRSSGPRSTTVFFYCENEHQESLQASYIVSSFIKQLCEHLRSTSRPLPKNIVQDINRFFGKKRTVPDFNDLESIFIHLFQYAHDTTYILDGFYALDETNCVRILKFLRSLSSESCTRHGSKCMLLSREQIPGFTNISTLIPGIRQISTSSNVMQDIQTYIETTIADKTMFKKLTDDPSLIDGIKEVLLKESSGMFLWVYLQLEIVWETCFTEAQIRLALKQLPKDLKETYHRCAERIATQDDIALRVLKWVSFATRPLSVEKLRETVAFPSSDTNWDPEKIPQRDFIAGCCANLVVVDPIDGRVRFAHPSVKPYLESDRGRFIEGYPVTAKLGEVECGEYCVTLSFILRLRPPARQVQERNCKGHGSFPGVFHRWSSRFLVHQAFPLSAAASKTLCFSAHPKDIPMKPGTSTLGYQVAVHHGPVYMASWGGRSKNSTKPLLLIALKSKEDLEAICDLPRINEKLPALHLASNLGYYAIVKLLLEVCNVNTLDAEGNTALHYAATKGHIGIVEIISFRKGSKLAIPSASGHTLLWLAASNGFEDIVSMLIRARPNDVEFKGANPQASLTPLAESAKNGHYAVVEVLLAYGANVDVKDLSGKTTLTWAAVMGHEAVVKILLKHGADPDQRDQNFSTPLSYAAALTEDISRRTPLAIAVSSRKEPEAIVKLLLDRGARPCHKDVDGRPPLSRAAMSGHDKSIKLMLEGDFDCDEKDKGGRTPLAWASFHGHEKVVELLLKKGADPDRKDCNGRAPVSKAAKRGHVSVVKLLLESRINPLNCSKDHDEYTPLSYATRNGHVEVMKLLLEKGQYGCKKMPKQDVLCYASEKGLVPLVKMLLGMGVDPNGVAQNGSKALSRALETGQGGIANLLLHFGASMHFLADPGEYSAR
ncbi:ankyrin repeat domain-containing protein [Paracoccidioides lutzii Pb01]|uniref:Ankyrin repeat domain-containing protein n=1 Tax=Paracoccidioides lutzii (strain ATCC MYA-826 / Pb01) TaxID=502779 RepID=C1GQI2_PARBA|nr:ankyrin repeat domain-containing protein [Paracoccidioides lutzii Pb01]EEH37856.2 ankyrin repeat domain-containing protein [Paracoccidioides lutzii Pb01]